MEQVVERRSTEPLLAMERPVVRGKFLYVGEDKFWVRGVSYGTFLVDDEGNEQLAPEVVERDFSRIAENGFNVVRVHLCPPRWLLDTAQKNGLRVMVGLNWGEHMSFIDKPGRSKEIEERMRRWVRSCAGHPAVFCYSVGNEISSSIVRWTCRRRVEEFVKRLYRVAKEEDPDALVTYVNYPSTEYLQLPFLDFLCFNVYLESQKAFGNYIARLHSLSQDRPVLLSEIGLDSLRNGEEKQAETLDWQIRTIFRQGCCGVVVFAWTDEWYHGKYLVEDWKFGLTTRDRTPKLALRAVKRAFLESPFPSDNITWPRISVVVCSFNGASTIRETLEGLQNLDYPDFEVIVVNDGSTDSTPEIASNYPVRLINTENRGLSQARNTGIKAATGEIVAFIDDDAYPEIHWLRFLALALMEGKAVGVGGPNLPPPNDGWRADAIANAPGGPNPVLISDTIAEHIPGCNMAFWKDALEAIGGFDPRFRSAGDDVDVCWRLRDRGGVIGYSPGAVVWHHRRRSFRRFWRQQVGYGKAEALLERKWPSRYSPIGQLTWLGRIYGKGVSSDLSSLGGRVYQGVWGTAPFQSLYQSSGSRWSWALMPEWYVLVAILFGMFLLGVGWQASLLLGPALLLTIALPVAQAAVSVARTHFVGFRARSRRALAFRTVVLVLHLSQPLARLVGRMRGGLTPWRRRGPRTRPRFWPMRMIYWREEREPPEDTLKTLLKDLQAAGATVRAGGEFDSWDLEVRGGPFGRSRLLLAVEDHAPRQQLLRFRISPEVSWSAIGLCAVFVGLALGAFRSGVWVSSLAAAFLAAWVAARTWADTGFSGGILREWIRRFGATETVPPTGDPSDEIETASDPSRRTETREEGIE